ncbi:unnamed protein product [Linum tenue]|uniref:Uncharacterized protein n=1 Tax=Linum tenue TaxID=586396 RepID=A0AAV0P2D3_9ROSI|nr:unnamed protein product [Linum tenue]
MGPYLWERVCRVRWIGSLRRWRWPMNGSEGGLGGRLVWSFRLFLDEIRSLEIMRAKRMAGRK